MSAPLRFVACSPGAPALLRQLALLSPDGLRSGRLATRSLSTEGSLARFSGARRRVPRRLRSSNLARSPLPCSPALQERSRFARLTADAVGFASLDCRQRALLSLGSLNKLLRSVTPTLAAPFPPLPAPPGFTPFYLPLTPSRRYGGG